MNGIIGAAMILALCNRPELERIAMVESGMNHHAVGDHGRAMGAWQMHKASWEEAAQRLPPPAVPFEKGHSDPEIARRHAAAYAVILIERYRKENAGRSPDWFDIYAMWRHGAHGYSNRKWDPKKVPKKTRIKAEFVRSGK